MKTTYRQKCYKCYRPASSCMCKYIKSIDTDTKFIILMHPKEFKKVKNGTGHLTHLSLKNSELFIGVDFSNHKKINEIISSHESYILYPSTDAVNLTTHKLENVQTKRAIFIIDSTWACSLKMIRESKNLQNLNHLSFTSSKLSQFKIKEQPAEYCLSTIESTLTVIELLKAQNIEKLDVDNLNGFLNPFHEMVKYQLKCVEDLPASAVRYKQRNGY